MIYFLAAFEFDLFKIGNTRCLAPRLSNLKTGSPCETSLLLTIPGGKEVENKLHKHFASQKSTREWFLINDYSRRFIKILINLQNRNPENIFNRVQVEDEDLKVVYFEAADKFDNSALFDIIQLELVDNWLFETLQQVANDKAPVLLVPNKNNPNYTLAVTWEEDGMQGSLGPIKTI